MSMKNMTIYVGEPKTSGVTDQIYEAIQKLYQWIEENDYSGYDTFDGLSSPAACDLVPGRYLVWCERSTDTGKIVQGPKKTVTVTRSFTSTIFVPQ